MKYYIFYIHFYYAKFVNVTLTCIKYLMLFITGGGLLFESEKHFLKISNKKVTRIVLGSFDFSSKNLLE